MSRVPKYSQRRPLESSRKSRKVMRAIDERQRIAYWERFKGKLCKSCHIKLQGINAITGYCADCLEIRNKNFDYERLEKAKAEEQARAFEDKKRALRAK